MWILKAVGVFLTAAAVASCGFYSAARLTARRRLLSEVRLCLTELKERIRLYEERASMLGRVFGTNGIIRTDSQLNITVVSPQLKAEDVRLLTEFFGRLGMGDVESQLSLCEIYGALLAKAASEAEAEERQKAGLYRMSGSLAAAAVLILLI